MKIAYLASRPLGARILKHLLGVRHNKGKKYLDIACIVTLGKNRLEKSGVDKWWQDDIENIAKKHNIPVVPIRDILSYKPEMAFSVFYFDLIPTNILSKIPKGVTNLHFGYLPNNRFHDKKTINTYRGRGILSYAILNGEKYQAVTLHYVDKKIDQGPIIDYVWNKIGSQTTVWDLQTNSEEKAYKMFQKWLPKFINNTAKVSAMAPGKGKYPYWKNSKLIPLKEIKIKSNKLALDKVVRAFDFPLREPAFIKVLNGKKYIKIYLRLKWQQ